MRLLRPRKANPDEIRRDRLRRARVDAPTLRRLLPAATQVYVAITFDADPHLADAPRAFTTYPPAQAHFVYDCPFGDCDGTYDLNEAVFSMLRTETCLATGMLHCFGHRARRNGHGPRCGLRMTYEVAVQYAAVPSDAAAEPALAR